MKKKNLMALLLATAMCVGVLTGCGNEAETEKEQVSSEVKESSGEKPVEPSAQEVDEVKEPVNLVWARYGSTTAGDYEAGQKEVEEAMNEYLAENYGITVTMISYPVADYANQMNLELAADADIDIITCGTGIMDPTTLYKNGVALELTELLKTTPTLYESISEEFWNSTVYGGGYYFVPNIKETGTGRSYMANNTFVDKYDWDLSDIKSYEDFEPFLEELKNDEDCAYAFWPTPYVEGNTDDFAFITQYAGINIDGDHSKVEFIIDSKEFMEYCKLMRKWALAGYWPEDLMVNQDNYKTMRNQGQYGFQYWVTIPDGEAECESRYTVPCTEVRISESWLNSDSAMGSAYCINANTEKTEAAIKFLEALETDMTLGDLAVYGVEGKHYTREADGSVTKIADSGYDYTTWTVTTLFNCSRLSTEAENKYELYEEFNANAVASPLAGFRFDSTPVNAEYTACNEVVNAYFNLFTYGAVDSEVEVTNYSKALKDAGVEKVIDEMQAQYDAFLAAK